MTTQRWMPSHLRFPFFLSGYALTHPSRFFAPLYKGPTRQAVSPFNARLLPKKYHGFREHFKSSKTLGGIIGFPRGYSSKLPGLDDVRSEFFTVNAARVQADGLLANARFGRG